jgi:hypothetical protein
MNESTYLYCTTHKKCLTDEIEVTEHRKSDCQFIEEEFKVKNRSKRKLEWQASSVTEKWGMKIYIPKKKSKVKVNTLPKKAQIYEPQRGRRLE